ncbi:type II secretion system protein J [Paucisalibacillus sp. EB02]|uniref:PulJ/GspJ family protein n=1 Tax=Paucisalibacillus sp. EB02 TaxID=1347087 RepID=UPI0004B4F9E4|nr:prepilin-type N-terminal cleavage/methylation domain-containing protein [Paucisalibacillus sp. EB02]
MKSDKGFTISEVLVSLTVLLIISTAVLPLTSFVANERKTLSQKRIITYKLQDELQAILQDDFVPITWRENIETVDVIFSFTGTDEGYIQGCAVWNNLMNRQEEVCLYGLSEK